MHNRVPARKCRSAWKRLGTPANLWSRTRWWRKPWLSWCPSAWWTTGTGRLACCAATWSSRRTSKDAAPWAPSEASNSALMRFSAESWRWWWWSPARSSCFLSRRLGRRWTCKTYITPLRRSWGCPPTCRSTGRSRRSGPARACYPSAGRPASAQTFFNTIRVEQDHQQRDQLEDTRLRYADALLRDVRPEKQDLLTHIHTRVTVVVNPRLLDTVHELKLFLKSQPAESNSKSIAIGACKPSIGHKN